MTSWRCLKLTQLFVPYRHVRVVESCADWLFSGLVLMDSTLPFALKCSWLDTGLFLKGSESIGAFLALIFFKALAHIFSGIFSQVDKFARCSNMFEYSSRWTNGFGDELLCSVASQAIQCFRDPTHLRLYSGIEFLAHMLLSLGVLNIHYQNCRWKWTF